MNCTKRICFILICFNLSVATSESYPNFNKIDSHNSKSTFKNFKKSLIERYTEENKISQSGPEDTLFDKNYQHNSNQIIPMKQDDDKPPDLFIDRIIASTSSDLNVSFQPLNSQIKHSDNTVDNKDTNRNSAKKKGNSCEESLDRKRQALECSIHRKYFDLIIEEAMNRYKIKKRTFKRYFCLKGSKFMVACFDKLLKSCFPCFNSAVSEKFDSFIVNIFLYCKFSTVKSSEIARERIKKLLRIVGKKKKALKTYINTPQHIFCTKKDLKKMDINKQLFIYPNLSSYRKYIVKRDENKFIGKTTKNLPDLKKNIKSNLKNIVKEYLEDDNCKLNEEDKKEIKSQLTRKFYYGPFKSIIEMGIRGINLEEDNNIFQKFYNNISKYDYKGNLVTLKGSNHAIEIQKFIIFTRICISENQNQLSCLESIALLYCMRRGYKEYKRPNKMEELFYDSLCFFIESIGYSYSISRENIYCSFDYDLSKYIKGFELLKRQLFPNWEELISCEDFRFLP